MQVELIRSAAVTPPTSSTGARRSAESAPPSLPIVAVEGEPLKDIRAVTTGVRWVMKDGVVVVDRRDERPT